MRKFVRNGVTLCLRDGRWFFLDQNGNGGRLPAWREVPGSPAGLGGFENWCGEMTDMVKRIVGVKSQGQTAGLNGSDLLATKYPSVWEFLTAATWPEDGSARVTGTLMLFVDKGQFKATMKDRDGGHVVFVSGDGLLAVLEALESGLEADDLDWRIDQYHKPQGPHKKRGK